jgi:hypothetical protein
MEVAVAAMEEEEEEANDGDGGSDHRGPCSSGKEAARSLKRG